MDHTWQAIAVVGPTATGKTQLAEAIALELGGEVVTADSMQVYRGMDIGTAKHPVGSRRVAHHCIDLVEPGFPFSAALYQREARGVIEDLLSRNRVPVLAGGTGLYVRAALDVMEFPSGESSSPARQRLETLAREIGAEKMHLLLAESDPASADLIHPNNVRRTIRALEMHQEGSSYAEQAARFSRREPFFASIHIGLSLTRETLYQRINDRVDRMLEAGLLDEVRQLLDAGFRDALTAQQAIGYKEMVPVLEAGADLDQASDDVKRASRRYAKRQLTWFRADPRVRWINVEDREMESVLAEAMELIASNEPQRDGSPEGLPE